MTDIVKRLRELSLYVHSDFSIGDEAAEEIESLRQQLAECNAKYKAHHGYDWSTLEACHESKREVMHMLAESQARNAADGWRQCAKGQRTTQYCGATEEAIKQAKLEGGREALLEAADRVAAAKGQPENDWGMGIPHQAMTTHKDFAVWQRN